MSSPPSTNNSASVWLKLTSAAGKNSNTNTEQPKIKRQKIEKVRTNGKSTKSVNNTIATNKIPPTDINETCKPSLENKNSNNHICSSLSSIHSISTSSSSNNSATSTPSSSRTTSLSQLLNVQNLTSALPLEVKNVKNENNKEESSHCESVSSSNVSSDEVDRGASIPDLLPIVTTNPKSKKVNVQINTNAEVNASQDMRAFEDSLIKQCLCGVPERILRKPFQSHYSLDASGQKRIANLNEWPTNKLLQFLSNLQLLFNIYLKQNSKGYICARIMDLCDALIRNDHNLIDEIIALSDYKNSYVQFLAGRVVASFLVIAKQHMDDNWLKKLVDILFNFDQLDDIAVQKIHFSLEIIKRIIEWKDDDLHPLDDTETDTPRNAGISDNCIPMVSGSIESHAHMNFRSQQPTLENNYFAMHFGSADSNSNHNFQEINRIHDEDTHFNSLQMANGQNFEERLNYIQNTTINLNDSDDRTSASTTNSNSGCHVVTLTDSESFDTTHLKCITIKIFENKWPALVKNMSNFIANHLEIESAENCILNFLNLWENIISVKANLSITETLPFYAQLDKLELLLNQNLSCTVYKQMLCLFNEALCYGSTLALQDMLPEETCLLAHQIVRHVKDSRILESLPRRKPENIVGLIGFKAKPVIYKDNILQNRIFQHSISELAGDEIFEIDKTIMQKIVLLVLKSIAVTVKEIRSDSSDSSIDSTDYDAFQDMVLIERSIRDVLHKLESFTKNILEFHPDCHFSKMLIHLFDDQDDHLIEAMVCTLDVTAGISFRNNTFPELVIMLNPVLTFLEFLKMISNSSDLLLDLLVSNETCFLLYLLRFLKYIRMNWTLFVRSCQDFGAGLNTLDEAMSVLIRLRLQISRLVSRQLYPYDISPVLRLLENCESLYEGNELN